MRTSERVSTGTVATVVFGLLVVSTVGAFFVTQRLKRAAPVIRHIKLPRYVSPNGDGRIDRAVIKFELPKSDDRVTVSITDANGDEVRRLATRPLKRGRHRFVWNGRNGAGQVVPDGFYYLRVVVAGEGRGTISRRGMQIETSRPIPKLVSAAPARIRPGGREAVTLHFTGPADPRPVFSVYRTDSGRARLVTGFTGAPGAHEAIWDGRVRGRPASPGTYSFAVTVQNKAQVAGSSPPRLPPTARGAQPHTGVTIAGLAAAPPLEPVSAGVPARVVVTGAVGRVRWSLFALGSRRALRRGSGQAPGVTVGVPRNTRTGVYVVRLSSRVGRAQVPLAVRSRRPARRVLVVLPAITWQGLNRVDDDADGFPDTLDESTAVSLARAFAGGRLPAGFGSDVVPLLRFLRAAGLPYDLTTDLALANRRGPGFAGHGGVVFAGTERWFTENLDRRLRAYVERGGRVASFGTDAFRRTVGVTAARLTAPSPAQDTNVLGEQTRAAASAAAPLVVNPGDSLGLFSGTDGFVGLFTRFEQSRRRVGGTHVVASAGREPDHPAFVAYRLGRGLVVRTGTPEWSAMLSSDAEVANVTKSLWSLLSR
ncbi:MAG: hypothetical protein QOH76_4052 [Thermoleophilaceae bacterium]|nr:hypothetical protein [Thermoleophilaceae bacterium]